MKIVKLTFNFDWPLFRQTSNYSQSWGNYKFIIDEKLESCDYWIIYSDYNLKVEKTKCNPNNIIFIPGEGYHTSPKFTNKFLNQFGAIITSQRQIKHRNVIYTHNANPWFINKSYDDLNSESSPEKTKLISVVTSNKVFTEGHSKRLEFVHKLKEYFGDTIDVFGRGINDFEDKWEVLADYKYSIAIENDFCIDYVTEKYFDCLYSNTLQFYYGCPNLESYVDDSTFIRIDINDFNKSVKIIEKALENNEYEKRKQKINKEKIKSLNRDQFFPFITNIMDGFCSDLQKKNLSVYPNNYIKPGNTSINRIRGLIIKKMFSFVKKILKAAFG